MPLSFRSIALLIVLLMTESVRADTVTLKSSITITTKGDITLAQVADLSGPQAERLADVVISASSTIIGGSAGTTPDQVLDLRTIREAIDREPGVNWAFLTLRGRAVTIRTRIKNSVDDESPQTVAAVGLDPAKATNIELLPGSIGVLAREVVRTILQVQDQDLRIVWPERHLEFLSGPVGERTVHVEPIGTSDRMPLAITIYEGDRIVRTENIRAEIRVRRTVLVLAKPHHRGSQISETDITKRITWVGPGVDPATVVVGQICARRLEAGSIIEHLDITPPLVIERGELITLHCVAGAVAIRSPARALADARDGETIVVEMESTGRRVLARANGAGNAVLVVRPSNTPIEPDAPLQRG